MGKIFYVMGKSSSGKDTLFQDLKREFPQLRTIVLYTTRPIREGEKDGVEYFFVEEEKLDVFRKAGRLIEERAYDTIHGIWRYATVDDGQICLEEADYLAIGTLESYNRLKAYFGSSCVIPLYVEVEDGERLKRALAREERQESPRYEELCRRFLADAKDFSEENLREAGISKRFYNENRSQCFKEMAEEIKHGKF
ncbi:guanylate kinase [Suipraeoptans intestinalis]|uniref:guanylate kinase n=1 Tax=Suipraeoptans intestinalis TaxID=2606628 RepID=UPI0023F4C601|nr:guanylate kinase [Suipraeoptans intestinalis]MDD7770636.1 guanylate kinase [Suipraeoptans intestinalis]MDY3121154.1 guanylate kinase [Suipraeoptans intestinalis]